MLEESEQAQNQTEGEVDDKARVDAAVDDVAPIEDRVGVSSKEATRTANLDVDPDLTTTRDDGKIKPRRGARDKK